MSAEMNDREWQIFMNIALGTNTSEGGLLIDSDPQSDLTTWQPADRDEPGLRPGRRQPE